MWGHPEQFKEMVRKIEYKKWVRSSEGGPGNRIDYFHLLVATTNVYDYTYDGVDHGGERIAEEVRPFELWYRQSYTRDFAAQSDVPLLDPQGSGKN